MEVDCWRKMRKFDLSLRSSRSSYFATFRHQLTILSKTDALDEEKWLNMLGTFVKDWFRYESHFVHGRDSLVDILKEIPKHLFQGYLNIYNNYFKAPWMPDRTEANPNELNQDDARYGFRCCHLKNIWTAPLPPETELSRQMTTSTTSIDIMGLQAAYANLHTDQERDYFMQR